MLDTDIEKAAELIAIMAGRVCEHEQHHTPRMTCRDYWGGEPEQWCLTCAAAEWSDDWMLDRSGSS